MSVTIRFAGPLQVTTNTARLDAAHFPGRQGRLVFAALALARRPVDRNELADILWPNRLPSSWTRDLSAVISKLRTLLVDVAAVETGGGRWYAIAFPADATIDIDVAAHAIGSAERDRHRGEIARALDATERAAAILSEPFLAGDECAWVDDRRAGLHELLVRGLALRAEMLGDASSPAAVAAAQSLLEYAPHDEHAHLLVMQAHLARDDRVEALRAYERLRRMLAEDFGLSPSARADELMHHALGSDDAIGATAPSVPLPLSIVDARRAAMIGRDAELRRLDALLDLDATARLAAVVGPAGIGKSRLACEAAARAHERGCAVVYAVGTEGPATPYRLIEEAFTAVAATPGVDESVAARAGEVVRGLARPEAATTQPEPPRAGFVAGVANAIVRFTANATLLVVVDDWPWADPASVRVLEHLLATESRVRIIATVRSADDHATDANALFARLHTKDGAFVVRLGGWALSEVAAALAAQGAATVDPAVVHAVHHATGGNPLYVREIGRHIAVAGNPSITVDGPLLDAIGLPRGLAELIDANLARLGAGARRVLETCSVIGGPIELGVLARGCGLPEPDLLAAVDVVERAGVLVESSADGSVLRFDHPLVREVLLHSLGSARRAQLHQRVAEAIEAYHHDEVERYSAELAHHLSAAAHVGSARDAIEFAVRAGERASAVCAYDEAVYWFTHALRVARERNDGPDSIARLLTTLGDAQNHAGDAGAARAVLAEAVTESRAAQNPDRFARAVLHLGGVLVDDGFEGGAVDDQLVELVDEALVGLPEASPARARLLVRLAEELHFGGDRNRCLDLCGEAEVMARTSHDADALVQVLGARHYALYGAPEVNERLALITEIQTLRTVARPDARWVRDYLELGDLQAAEAAASHLERQIAASGIASDRYYPAVWRATRAALRGELDVAEAAADEAVEVGRAAARGPAAIAGVWAAQIFSIRLFDGRLGELRDLVAATAEASPARPIWRAAAAFMHLELDEPDSADRHFRCVRKNGFDRLPDTIDRPLTLALLAWVAAEIGSATDARALRRLLRPYRDLLVVLGAAAPSVCAGPVTYPLAMLEARLGRRDAAAALLTCAEQQASQIDAPLWRDRIRRARNRLQPETVRQP